MARTEITAAEALKAFKTRPLVQTAKPGTIRYKDDAGQDKERPGFITKDVSLSEEHVLSAVKRDNRVIVVTIDGKKHEAAA